jgi:hypothetical protein
MTHLESPALAQKISVSVIKATQAVQPVYNEILSVSGLPNREDYDSSGAEYFFISFTP